MSIVYIGIGSNVGDKEKNCREAIKELGELSSVKIRSRSGFYITDPVGGPPQDDFVNTVVKEETTLSPDECLKEFKRVEKKMGRTKSPRNHPRVIDVDILMYGDMVLSKATLTIPHPRMHERYFVLRGFVEIAPEVVHPVLHKTIRELYGEMTGCKG
jgi:2-amino-4-hydroxy-6-hydroxymethyldihydropteridine diphosphokinase